MTTKSHEKKQPGPRLQPAPDAQQNAEKQTSAPQIPAAEPITITRAELQSMIDDGIKSGLRRLSSGEPINDVGYWQANCRCQSAIFGCIDPGRIVFLTMENEKSLRLGQFAEEIVDEKTGRKITLTYAHLKKPNPDDLRLAIAKGDVQPQDGMAVLPPLRENQSLDPDRRPFRLVSQGGAGA